MKRHIKQAGDTIVEVLLCIVVISVILAGGYAVARQSLIAERRAEERGEALQLVQSQIEELRTLVTIPTTPFCMTGPSTATATGAFTGAPTYPHTPTAYSNYPAACIVNNLGISSPTTGEAALYHLSIVPNTPINNTFWVLAIWDQDGGGQENVSVLYQLQ